VVTPPDFDIALIRVPPEARENASNLGVDWAPQGVHDLGGGIFVGRLPMKHRLRAKIGRACSRRGDLTIESNEADFEFWRVRKKGDDALRWDDDDPLQQLVGAARLVRPHAGDRSDMCAVRRWPNRVEVVEAKFQHMVWTFQPRPEEAYFTDADVAALRKLWSVFPGACKVPEVADRLTRAIWYYQYAQHTREIDVRWPILVIALEALVKPWQKERKGGRTAEEAFIDRALQIGKRSEVAWDDDLLERTWLDRSRLAHGQPLGQKVNEMAKGASASLADFEDGVRRILHDAVLNPNLDAVLRDLGTLP
jgi:hypothetical protein